MQFYGVEMIYILLIFIASLIGLAVYFQQLNWFIGLIAFCVAIISAYFIGSYTLLVFVPLKNAVWYGYDWTWLVWLALINLLSMIALIVQLLYNLYMSDGKKPWG